MSSPKEMQERGGLLRLSYREPSSAAAGKSGGKERFLPRCDRGARALAGGFAVASQPPLRKLSFLRLISRYHADYALATLSYRVTNNKG